MLTKEEIKNLRIGDEIYFKNNKHEVNSLDVSHIGITNVAFSKISTDPELSMKPIKKMKKFWLWAIQVSKESELKPTPLYYDDDFLSIQGIFSIKNVYFKQKLDYSMVEIEEK